MLLPFLKADSHVLRNYLITYCINCVCSWQGCGGSHARAKRSSSSPAERSPQASCSIRQNTGAWSCSARLVADTRPAKLDLFLTSLHTFAKGRCSPQAGCMLGLPLLPESSSILLASCWPSSHHWLAGSGEESCDSDVPSFSRVHPIAWLMGSFCVMPCLCCWQGPPLTDVLTTGWKTGSTSGPKPDSILSVLATILMDSGSMTSAHRYVVSCSSLV